MDIILTRVFEFKKLKPFKREVLRDEKAIQYRMYKLKKGLEYSKYNIQTLMLIVTNEEEKWLRSTIFRLTGKKIMIKGKVELPITCVKEVYYKY